ncbi:MAG: sensor histidine kinase [Bacteroidales bacterium]|nr:sensor histidine kinase [Bacteroidales bacterium]
MKKKSTLILALIISAAAAAITAVAMTVAVNVSEGDKDRGTLYAVIGLMAAVFVVGGCILKWALDTFRTKVEREAKMEYDKKLAEKLDENTGDGLSKIVSQLDDDVAQWARDKVNEITILRNNEKFRREYISNVSHELKTPLNNIQGYIETLIDGGLKDDEINMTYLERTDRNISRLISIVRDLDTISRLESGMVKLSLEDFDLVDVVEEVLEFNEKKAEGKHIALKMENTTNGPVMVNADKRRIYEVITNLVVNSINYGNENGTTEVIISDIENKYLLDVKDNGIGISADNIGRVFERFYRVDKSRSRDSGGTGLGLAIVKHIIEAHNEMITVKSKIGVGTTFSITLKKANN